MKSHLGITQSMKTSSCKAKGRRLQKLVVAKILSLFSNLSERDVQSRAMGSQGTDIVLSEAAHKCFPFSVECKNRETNKGLYDAYDQAISNCNEDYPLVVLGRNTREPLAVIKLDTLLRFYKGFYEAGLK